MNRGFDRCGLARIRLSPSHRDSRGAPPLESPDEPCKALPVDLNTIATVATALTVMTGLFFGLLQTRQAAHKRRDLAAIELTHSFQTTELRNAFRRILSLAEPLDPATIRNSPTLIDDAEVIVYAGEAMGLMVFEGAIRLHTLDRMMGGFLRAAWRRLSPYVEEERRTRSASYAEWFQWLFERFEEHPVPGKAEGAHVAHRAWMP